MRHRPFSIAAPCNITALTLLVLFGLGACEKDVTVDLPDPESMLVVEGYIESGRSPYLVLTRNAPYFGGFDLNDLESYLVTGATVRVWDDQDTVQLVDTCIHDFPPALQQQIAQAMGFSIPDDDSAAIPNFCVYVEKDLFNPKMTGQPGKTYHLEINYQGETLRAKTHIPWLTPLDTAWYRLDEVPEDTSLVRIYIQVNDPDTAGNFIRYFTKRNDEAFIPGLNSVYDDLFINGEVFHVPIDRGQRRDELIDLTSYGYFWRGDTVTVRWNGIDRAHYDFWRTLEQEMNTSGPFSNPTVIQSNIEGGLGVWGGYAVTEVTVVIPE